MELFSGKLLLLHPVHDKDQLFLPCAYGYATTIRNAQGASLDAVVLFFDHSHPPERGYGYVGASRCKSKAGLYFYGRLRRTDWLPVGDGAVGEALERTSLSQSSPEVSDHESESEGEGLLARLSLAEARAVYGDEVPEEVPDDEEFYGDLAEDLDHDYESDDENCLLHNLDQGCPPEWLCLFEQVEDE